MTRRGVVALLLVMCAITAAHSAEDVKSVNGYGKATWGMTQDQVLKAEAPGAKRAAKPEELGALRGDVVTEGVQIGPDTFTVIFYFDATLGLQTVVVKFLDDQQGRAAFGRLEKHLTTRYGPPNRKEGGTSPRVFWELPKTTVRLVNLNVFGFSRTNVSYMPSTVPAATR